MFKEATTMKKHYGSFRELLSVTKSTLIMGSLEKPLSSVAYNREEKSRRETFEYIVDEIDVLYR
jgi:hypothetical protein